MTDHIWEEAPVDFRPSRARHALSAFGRWVVGLFIVGSLTLGTAFYLPLYRAHRALTEDHTRALVERRTLERDLSSVRAELGAAEAGRRALETTNAAAASKASTETAQIEEALAMVRTKLGRLVDRKTLSVNSRDGRLVVAFSPGTVLGLENAPVRAVATHLGLCDVSKALSGAVSGASAHGLDVIAYVDPPPVTPAAEVTADRRDVPSRLAIRVIESLESTCQVPPEWSSVVVRGSPSTTGAKLELTIDPHP